MLYLWLLILTLAGPLAFSFDSRLNYLRKWRGLFAGLLITASYFLIWDEIFTRLGYWGFNRRYLLGVYICSLPLEEVLFFFVVPFSCVFIYVATKHYVSFDIFGKCAHSFSLTLGALLLGLSALFYNHAYTFVTFGLTSALLLLHALCWRKAYLGRFYLGYTVSLLPFLMVDGILTGSFIVEPVVWYNDAQNLGIRIGTIPIEDSVYLLLMLLSVITIYEARFFKKREEP